MKTRKLLILFLSVLLVVTLTSCQSSQPSSGTGQVEINFCTNGATGIQRIF